MNAKGLVYNKYPMDVLFVIEVGFLNFARCFEAPTPIKNIEQITRN